jgi:hypothetical protein
MSLGDQFSDSKGVRAEGCAQVADGTLTCSGPVNAACAGSW